MRLRFAILFSMVAGIFGCGDQTAPEVAMQHSKDETSVLKIAVFADGRLTVDGTPSSLEDLRESLREISEKGGVVWHYREPSRGEPPPIALEVIEAVMEARVPVRLSTRPDYSDSVGP